MSTILKGIDVSKYQGQINWKVTSNYVDFVIIRCGYGDNLESQDDPKFYYNISEAKKYNVPVGIYLYSYATNVNDAKSEAQHVLRLVKNINLEYPIYYDLEDEKTVGKLTNSAIGEIADTFCSIIEDNGYYVGIYGNSYWFNNKLTSSVFNKYDKWIARYSNKVDYDGNYGMWQYSNKGKVAGITTDVDLNYSYKNYKNIIYGINNSTTVGKTTRYKVVRGDNLSSIAKKYSVSINAIANANNLSNPNLIYAGQMLIIPTESISYYTYVVKSGDTLSGIAKKYSTNYKALASYNGISNPNKIYPGQIIKIPK